MRWTKILIVLLFTASFVQAQDAATLYDEGVKLKTAKKCTEAIDKFKKALLLKPNYPEAMYEMGWCQNELKNYSAAIDLFRKVRPSWTDIPKLYFELGYAFEKSGLTDSAVGSYNKAIKLKPDYELAYKQLGYISYAKDDYENTLIQFAGYEAAEKSKGKPIEDYLYWYRKGFSHNALKQYADANSSLFKSLEFKTDYVNTYLEIGFAYSRLKQDDDAITYYKKAMVLDPASHIPLNGIGEVYRDNKKDRKEAMVWYAKTLAINPDERKANYGMGYCLNSIEKCSEAIPYLKKAIVSENTYTAAYVELGYSYYKTNDDQGAEKLFKKAIELNSKNENSRYYLGLLYIRQKNKIKAQQMVDELKILGSKNAASLQESVNKL